MFSAHVKKMEASKGVASADKVNKVENLFAIKIVNNAPPLLCILPSRSVSIKRHSGAFLYRPIFLKFY